MGITIPQDCRTPEVVAKECSLMEGIYYFGISYVPYEYEIGENVGDDVIIVKIRKSWDYLYNENDIRDFVNDDLSSFMDSKFGIPNPMQAIFTHESYEKYKDVHFKHIDNIDKDSFEKETLDLMSKIDFANEEHIENYKLMRANEKKLIEEYRLLDIEYYRKIEELTEDVKHELYLLIKNGKISITGVLRYNIKEGGDYENEDDLIETANTHNDREIIDVQNISYDCIHWEECEIITKNNKYYTGVLISFEDLYKEKPQQLEYEVNAKLLGDRIICNGKTYQEVTQSSTKGRKSLDWDLFYAELLRYIIENEKGVLPTKQEVTTTHMQNWCKNTGFSNGSRGSIQPKISAICDALQKVKK